MLPSVPQRCEETDLSDALARDGFCTPIFFKSTTPSLSQGGREPYPPPAVLAGWGCGDKVPPATKMCCLEVPEAQGKTSAGLLHPRAMREGSVPGLSPWPVAGCLLSLPLHSIFLPCLSASESKLPLSLRTLGIWIRAQLNDLILI